MTDDQPAAVVREDLTVGYDGKGVGLRFSPGQRCHMDAATTDGLIAALIKARRAAFGLPPPRATELEVFDRTHDGTSAGTGSLLLPTDVVLNGVPVYTQGGIKIHEIEIKPPKELARVTLTLPVRLVVVSGKREGES